jgi:hypothetical protein
LVRFIKRKGGINACAARFTRCLGREAPRRTGIRPAALPSVSAITPKAGMMLHRGK